MTPIEKLCMALCYIMGIVLGLAMLSVVVGALLIVILARMGG